MIDQIRIDLKDIIPKVIIQPISASFLRISSNKLKKLRRYGS